MGNNSDCCRGSKDTYDVKVASVDDLIAMRLRKRSPRKDLLTIIEEESELSSPGKVGASQIHSTQAHTGVKTKDDDMSPDRPIKRFHIEESVDLGSGEKADPKDRPPTNSSIKLSRSKLVNHAEDFYTGQLLEGMRHGKGLLKYADGSIYQGILVFNFRRFQ